MSHCLNLCEWLLFLVVWSYSIAKEADCPRLRPPLNPAKHPSEKHFECTSSSMLLRFLFRVRDFFEKFWNFNLSHPASCSEGSKPRRRFCLDHNLCPRNIPKRSSLHRFLQVPKHLATLKSYWRAKLVCESSVSKICYCGWLKAAPIKLTE